MNNTTFCFNIKSVIILLALGLVGCSSEQQAVLEGNWELAEVSVVDQDTADGYTPTTSDKELTLGADGVFESNGDLCTLSEGTDVSTTGKWGFTDNVLIIEGCAESIAYELTISELVLIYDCLESCKHKYVRRS